MALNFSSAIAFGLFIFMVYAPYNSYSQTSHYVRRDFIKLSTPKETLQNYEKDETVYFSKDKFQIKFLGNYYDKILISPNGYVSFGDGVTYTEYVDYSFGVKNPEKDPPFIAPLFIPSYKLIDVVKSDYQGSIYYQNVTFYSENKIPSDAQAVKDRLENYLPSAVLNLTRSQVSLTYLFIVTWDNVAVSDATDCSKEKPCNSTTFQLVLTGNRENTFAIFNYDKINISIRNNTMAGFNVGQGGGWYNVLPCKGGCRQYFQNQAITNLPNFQGGDYTGQYIYSVGSETFTRGGCLPDLLQEGNGILELSPRNVGMFGGERLEVSGLCGNTNQKIFCRFGRGNNSISQVVQGEMVSSMKGYCPVPLLFRTGEVPVYFSKDNQTWTIDGTINVVLPSRLYNVKDPNVNHKEIWNKRDSSVITVKWEPSYFEIKDEDANVEIKIIGYNERDDRVGYKYLATLGNERNSKGSYTFTVADNPCKFDCDQYEVGLLEVSLPVSYYINAPQRVAIRYGPIPLGWYVNQQLTSQRGKDWSDKKCKEWSKAETDTQWLEDLLPCPCSLDQALADFGRWQADPSCNILSGSICEYHKGAGHCVRSVSSSSKSAGNQCCYKPDGTLMYSQVSNQGSTPDRSHSLGTYPFNVPGKVPALSHWIKDVVPFYYCCLWNNYDLCDLYTEKRPTKDCSNYAAPSIGFVYGQGHIRTWDGRSYNFIGAGDFWLAMNNDSGQPLQIQGKFEPTYNAWDLGSLSNAGSSWKPKALTALAVKTGGRILEILAPSGDVSSKRGINIKIDNQIKYFDEHVSFWQDFQAFAVINNADVEDAHNNFTILLRPKNIGINVAAVNGLLHLAVALPPTLKQLSTTGPTHVTGLMGTYDGNSANEFINRDGTSVHTDNKIYLMQYFALTWRRNPEIESEKLFRFPTDSSANLSTYALSYVEYNDIPINFDQAPKDNEIQSLCGTSDNCKWDYRISGSRGIAQATLAADVWSTSLARSIKEVDSCGFPDVGNSVTLNNQSFLVGTDIKVTACGKNRHLINSDTYRCINETVVVAEQKKRADYGIRKTYNHIEYILHWVPKPKTACSEHEAEDAGDTDDLGIIIGASVGAVVLVAIIVVVVVVVLKKKKKGSHQTEQSESAGRAPKPSPKDRREVIRDPNAAEAMLGNVESRSPVYKPSADRVRMSELQGSNV